MLVIISYHVVDSLPDDAAAGLMIGDRDGHLYLRRGASLDEVAEALTELARQWVAQDWMYVGRVQEIA